MTRMRWVCPWAPGRTSTALITLAVTVAMFLVSRPVAAEGEPRSLTLEEALTMARQRNRNLVIERTRLAQAQTGIAQAWSVLFPTVAVQARLMQNYKEFELGFGNQPFLLQPSQQFDGVINVSAPLFAPSAYPALAAVKAGVRASEATFDVSETAVLVSVAQAFYAASIADEMVGARRSTLEVARMTLKNAEARFAAGTVTRVDVGRAELAVVRAEQLEREAGLGRASTYRALATLIQFDGPLVVKVHPVPPQIHDEAEIDAALQRRPEFRALQATLQSVEAQRRAHKWRWAPTLSAFGNARKFNYDNFARDRYSWAVGAQLDWVLYDGGTRDADRHLADARIDETRARFQALYDSVRDDLANGRRQLETKLRGVEAAERSVALAKETVDLVRVQYEAGSVTQVDLLQAQDALVAAQEALAQSHYDAAAADLFLRRAAGTFPGQ